MLEPDRIRTHFPSLQRTVNGRPLVYFDGPGGTQVTQSCIDGMVDYLTRCNANHGGAFASSVESDAIIAAAHEAMADFLNASSANAALGAGPPPIPRNRLSVERLTAAIRQAVGDPSIRARAAELGRRIRAEDGIGRATDLIDKYLS